ncbi:hypothetical protein [Thioclava sp. GXIMD2076]|uniref:Uncharacterized protein n=1 Tax=Thioclava kandeliae TaxID=3070818 RepID=A0ABV1SF81_9RHOB
MTAQIPPGRRLFSRNLRLSFFVLCAIYPLVTALLYVVLPLMDGHPLFTVTAVVCPIVVLSMVYAIIPTIHRRLGHLL